MVVGAATAGRGTTMSGYQMLPRVLADNDIEVVFAMSGGTTVAWLGQGVHRGVLRFDIRIDPGANVSAVFN